MAKRLMCNIEISLLQKYLLLSQCNRKSRLGLLNLFTTQAINICSSFDIHNHNEFYKKNIYNIPVYAKLNESLITYLSNILSVDIYEASNICRDIKKYRELTEYEIIRMITTLKKAGLSTTSIIENLPIFIRNIDLLEEKIYCLKILDDNITEMLPLLNVNQKYLNELISIGKEESNNVEINKLKYLADEMQCNLHILCQYIQDEPAILKLTIRKIKTVVKILKKFNCDLKDTLFDLRIFKYKPKNIHSKSSAVTAAGMNNIKLWIMRSSVCGLCETIKTLKTKHMVKTVYGSHKNFLTQKLNLTEEEVQFYISRSPELLNINIQKIDEVIKVLHRYEYSTQEILMCVRIFYLKTKLLEERLEALKPLRGKHRLSLICCSSKIFKTIIKNTHKPNNETTTTTPDTDCE
ncbi:hypothetical protein M0802_007512 [Mischocyttarus mexicanus]|nr:hypothetical protein M0802_007512 [Mischocyttarus mexicanus]